jgi:hypothetical protein
MLQSETISTETGWMLLNHRNISNHDKLNDIF